MYADQAVEVLLPIGAPSVTTLAAGVSSAAIDLGATFNQAVPIGFFVLVSCSAAFSVRAGKVDPGAAVATDFDLNASTPYRFKITGANFVARFFSTAGGSLKIALASR